MKHNDNYEQIDKYVRKDMNIEEKTRFDQQIQQDATLKKEVEMYQKITRVAEAKFFMEDLQAELEEEDFFKEDARNEVVERKNIDLSPRFSIRRFLAYAATISVLLIAGASLWANLNYSNTPLARMDKIQSVIEDARSRRGNEQNPSIDQADWLDLTSQKLKIDDYTGASQDLQEVLKTTSLSEIDREDAEWLLIQTKLANNEVDANFNSLLQKVINDKGHIHNNNAKLLQKDLDSIWRKLVW